MKKHTEPFKVAAVQHPPVFLNLEASVDRAIELIEEAAENGASIIAFPETWLPGYPLWLDIAPNSALWDNKAAKSLYRALSDNSLTIPGTQFNRLLTAAGKTGAYIVMGANEKVGGTLYNSLIYFDSLGVNYTVHRKLVPTYTERLVWGQGDGSTISTIETEFGVLGGLICWEHWMPLLRATMHARKETVHVAQWPEARELHQIASRHYAFEGQCFVIAAGMLLGIKDILDGARSLPDIPDEAIELLETIPSTGDEFVVRGGTAIVAPSTEYIVEPVFDRSEIVYAEIDPGRITEGHLVVDTDGHYSRPDIFSLEVDMSARLNVKEILNDDR